MKRLNNYELFLSIVVVATALLILWFRVDLLGVGIFRSLVIAFFESFILFLPFLYIKGILKNLIWIPICLSEIFLYSNTLYYRNFSDIIPASLYNFTTGANKFAIKGALASVHLSDFLLLLPLLIIILFYGTRHRYIIVEYISRPFKKLYLAVLALFLSLSILSTCLSFSTYIKSGSISEYLALFKDCFIYSSKIRTTWKKTYITLGTPDYLYALVEKKCSDHLDLTNEDISKIKRYFNNTPANISEEYTNVGNRNINKNLILIIVESFNASVFGKNYTTAVLPNLSTLSNDSTVFFCPYVLQQARLGRSSDGQLILNTGLLPLRNEAFVVMYHSSDYPSLSKALNGYRCEEVSSDSRGIWNHAATSISYGYTQIHDEDSESAGFDTDIKTMKKSLDIAAKIKQPFMLTIITITMHSPYNENHASDKRNLLSGVLSDMPANQQNYLLDVALMDESVGLLIDGLKDEGLYDNTIIVITGDHEADKSLVSPLDTDYVPLFIINAGINNKSKDNVYRQVDIFPTILDVMGVENYYVHALGCDYRGLGYSILRDGYKPTSDEDWEISDLLIRGSFFDIK